jgi:cytochrome c oxidase subunit 2
MKKVELAAVLLVLLVIVGTPSIILAYQFAFRPAPDVQEVTLIMRAPENGNITPSVIRVKKGQRVRLHVTSHDVTHGLLFGELGVDAGVIEAGKWKTVEFTPEETGEFSFTCNIRCSLQHPKVRGVIVVEE